METFINVIYIMLGMVSCFGLAFLSIAVYTFRQGGNLNDVESELRNEKRALELSLRDEPFITAILIILTAILGLFWFLKYSLLPMRLIAAIDRKNF